MTCRGIAYAGKRKSGKTWSAKYALSQFPETFVGIYSIADDMRRMFAEDNSIPVAYLTNNLTKEFYRPEFLKWRDHQLNKNPLVFILKWMKRLPSEGAWLCDDLRSEEELNVVDELGGVAIRIDCSNEVRMSRGFLFDPKVDNHITETALDDHPYFDRDHRMRSTARESHNKAAIERVVTKYMLGREI